MNVIWIIKIGVYMGTAVRRLVALLIAFLSWIAERMIEQTSSPAINPALATAVSAASGFGSVTLVLNVIPIIFGVMEIITLASPIFGYTAD